MNEKIWLSSPHMSEEGFEQAFVKDAFDSNWIAPLGPNVVGFESELAAKVRISAAAAMTSGTAAIHMALKAAGVSHGDIVLCQSLTFSASANPILYQNATPVFIDSDFDSWNMCPIALEAAFEKYPHAKVVIVVHLYGFAADLDPIIALCHKYNAILIEDAAESLGSFYKGIPTGTLGDYGVFSFNGNKIITTSGGGMLVSNNEGMIQKARFWITQSREDERHYEHHELGFNYRMSNVAAGIGRGQLKVLEERVAKKKYIYEFYKRELALLDGFVFQPVNDWDQPNYWLTTLTVTGILNPIDIIEMLELQNIEARPLWKPMHLQPFFSDFDYIGGNVSQTLFENGICLPSDTKMTDKDLKRVSILIKSLFDSRKSNLLLKEVGSHEISAVS